MELILDDLRAAISGSLERAHKARDFLFTSGKSLSPGIIEIRGIATPGTSNFTLRFNITDKLREFITALATGKFDGKIVKQRHSEPPVSDETANPNV